MNTYTTSEVAGIVGIHPNTVRFYEKMQLITRPERRENGYRVFTDLHIYQFKIARTAFSIELLQNGLRRQSVDIVKASAKGEIDKAIGLAHEYLLHIERERENAAEAVIGVREMLEIEGESTDETCMSRKETADYLGITTDTLRNWERNGLLRVKRRKNGYRVYTGRDIEVLKIIRSLRCANYSLAAILRMLRAVSHNPDTDIAKAIDTPAPSDDIISACDRLITSLDCAYKNGVAVKNMVLEMKEKFYNPPE